ncbi:MAG: DivIVA domain-containing protein [Parachlamydiaceae bacterium]
MKTLEKSQDKIQKICSILREETLAPAQKEAQDIIESAQQQAELIVRNAEKSAGKFLEEAKTSVEKERTVFQETLKQAIQQSLEALRQSIENSFFSDNLASIIDKSASDPKLVANLLNAVVKAIEKDGLDTDLTALVPKMISPRQLNELLMQDVLHMLRDKSVVVGNFSSGVQVKLNNKKIIIDISETALRELLSTYIARKDFRKLVFGGA